MKSDKQSDLLLKIELVPQTSWYSNLRSNISANDWDKLRKQVVMHPVLTGGLDKI